VNTPTVRPAGGRVAAVLQALLVTVLWSSSWVLIKIGLKESIPPLTFAGLRYAFAFLCLLPLVLSSRRHRRSLLEIPRKRWGQLILLGILLYAVTQGAQFYGLLYLPAATLSLVLSFTPLFVALESGLLRTGAPSATQVIGVLASAAGAVIYFLPLSLPSAELVGLSIAAVCVASNSAAAVLGRHVNSTSRISPLLVTTVSMGIGGILLLTVGATTQGLGGLELSHWLIIAWLAVVNTAVAFTLWNNSLRTLTAVESSVINGTMLPQIAILSWLFLGETLTPRQIAGLLVVAVGIVVVQALRREKTAHLRPPA